MKAPAARAALPLRGSRVVLEVGVGVEEMRTCATLMMNSCSFRSYVSDLSETSYHTGCLAAAIGVDSAPHLRCPAPRKKKGRPAMTVADGIDLLDLNLF